MEYEKGLLMYYNAHNVQYFCELDGQSKGIFTIFKDVFKQTRETTILKGNLFTIIDEY